MRFLRSFLRLHFVGKPVVVSPRNIGCFSGYNGSCFGCSGRFCVAAYVVVPLYAVTAASVSTVTPLRIVTTRWPGNILSYLATSIPRHLLFISLEKSFILSKLSPYQRKSPSLSAGQGICLLESFIF